MKEKTVKKPHGPYARATITDAEHRHLWMLADYAAARSAKAIANGSVRLGQAHKYLLAAHLQQFMDGAGEEMALDFLDDLVADLTRG